MGIIELQRRQKMVVAALDGPHRVLSWAVCGGGMTIASAVVWTYFRNTDLPIGADPVALLRARLVQAGLPGAVGMMTSRNLDHVHTASVEVDGVQAEAVATVGLSNALRVGDPPGRGVVGTINLLVRLSTPLSPAAMVEAISIATEARTAAVTAAGWPSRRTGHIATGTGTDCIVIAAPLGEPAQAWCGKHTAEGSAIGQSTLTVIDAGVRTWLTQRTEK